MTVDDGAKPADGDASKTDASSQVDFIDGAEILLVGFADDALARRLEGRSLPPIRRPATLGEAESCMVGKQISLMVFGPGLTGSATADVVQPLDELIQFLEAFKSRHPYQHSLFLTVGLTDPGALIRLVHADLVYFAEPTGEDLEALADLVAGAFAHYRNLTIEKMAAQVGIGDRRAVTARALSELSESLHQAAGLDAVVGSVSSSLHQLLEAESSNIWLYDAAAHTLTDAADGELEMSAVVGITAYAARADRPVMAASIWEDPRYDADIDGAPGHLLALPLKRPDGEVLGVLAMRRSPRPFDGEDLDVAKQLASRLEPIVFRLTLSPTSPETSLGGDAELFRQEALDAQARGFNERGRILQNTAGWTVWTWRLLLSGFVVGLLFTIIGHIHDYAAGPAVVRVGERVDVTAPTGAPVVEVVAETQQAVRAGDPLVRLFGAPQASLIENLEEEFEQRLRQRLADPGDAAAEASLVDVRTRLEDARARLDERTVRAPIDGVVGDIRVRPGLHPDAGEILMSIIADADQRTVIGLIPGHFRPQLEAGQRIRLALQGYPDLALQLRVATVGEEVIAATQARAAVGRTVAAPVENLGSVVVVEATLPESSFTDGRRTLEFSDGMQGSMEIRVRSRPLLFHLIPGLDTAFRALEDSE